MASRFQDYSELVLYCRRDIDYRFNLADRGALVTVAAIHGGGIEPLTSELATAIASEDCNLYDFQGIRPSGNDELYLPTSRFTDMRLATLMQRSYIGLNLLGSDEEAEVVHLGGRNRRLKRVLEAQLQQAGFQVAGPAGPGAVHDPSRFFNLAATGGVQIELSRGLRTRMARCGLYGFGWQQPDCWTERFWVFVSTVRSALAQYMDEVRGDADLAMETFEETTRTIPRELRSCYHHHRHHDEDDQS